ncbi:MAG: hypothetical protein HRU19_19745 [Pseudobacteriovorax sp.]|nr:hypothetical protein [Pseudobacteriovorax sp.]
MNSISCKANYGFMFHITLLLKLIGLSLSCGSVSTVVSSPYMRTELSMDESMEPNAGMAGNGHDELTNTLL